MSDIPIDLDPQNLSVFVPIIKEGRVLTVYGDCTMCIAARPHKGSHEIHKYYCTLHTTNKKINISPSSYKILRSLVNRKVVKIDCLGISKNGRLSVVLYYMGACVNSEIANSVALQNFVCKN